MNQFQNLNFPGFLIDPIRSQISFQGQGFAKTTCIATDHSFCQFQEKPDFSLISREDFRSAQSSIEYQLGLDPGTVRSADALTVDTFLKLPGGGAVWLVENAVFKLRKEPTGRFGDEFIAKDGLFHIQVNNGLPVVRKLAENNLTGRGVKLMCADEDRVYVIEKNDKKLYEVPLEGDEMNPLDFEGKIHCFAQTGSQTFVGVCSKESTPIRFKLQRFILTEDTLVPKQSADLQFVGKADDVEFMRLLTLGNEDYVLYYTQKPRELEEDNVTETETELTDNMSQRPSVSMSQTMTLNSQNTVRQGQISVVQGRAGNAMQFNIPSGNLLVRPNQLNQFPPAGQSQAEQLMLRQKQLLAQQTQKLQITQRQQTVQPQVAPIQKLPAARTAAIEHVITRFRVNKFQACEVIDSNCVSSAFDAVGDEKEKTEVRRIVIDAVEDVLFVYLATQTASALFYQSGSRPVIQVVPFNVSQWFVDQKSKRVEVIVQLEADVHQRIVLEKFSRQDLGDKRIMTRSLDVTSARVRLVSHFMILELEKKLFVITMRDMYSMFLLQEMQDIKAQRLDYERLFQKFQLEDIIARNTFNMNLAKKISFDTPFYAFGYDQSRAIKQAINSCQGQKQLNFRTLNACGILMITNATKDHTANAYFLKMQNAYVDLFGGPQIYPQYKSSTTSNYTLLRNYVRVQLTNAISGMKMDEESPLLYNEIFEQRDQQKSFPLKDLRGIAQCGSSVFALTGDKRVHCYEVEFQKIVKPNKECKLRPAFILTRYFDLSQLLKIYVSENLTSIEVIEMYGQDGKVYFTFKSKSKEVKIVQDFSQGAIQYDNVVIE